MTELPATPGTIRLPLSPRDVRLFCIKPGYAPTVAVLPAQADAEKMALMAVAGGLGGLAGAALSGQGYRYPPSIAVTLPALNFGSDAEKAAYVARRVAETRATFDEEINVARSMCRPDEFGCQTVISAMVRARDAELANLELWRAAAP